MSKITKSIKEYLEKNDLYHESDSILIDEIEFNIMLMNECKADIKQNGYMVDITRNENKDPFFQKNRSVDVYQQALKNVQAIFKQLILSPSERQKLKIELSEKVDEFAMAFANK